MNRFSVHLPVNSLAYDIEEELLQEDNISDCEQIKNKFRLAEIPIIIHDKLVSRAMLDSGSEVNAINKAYCDRLEKQHGSKFTKLPVQNVQVVSALGKKHKKVTHQVMLQVKFRNQIVHIVFLIIDNLNSDVLLGVNFMKQNKIILNFDMNFMQINDEQIKFIEDQLSEVRISHIQIQQAEFERELQWENQVNKIKQILEGEVSNEEIGELIRVFENSKPVFSDIPGKVKGYQYLFKVNEPVNLNKKSYPVPYSKRKAVEEELEKLLDQGVIEVSDSPYISPLVVVIKTDNSIRLCLDCRGINKYIVRSHNQPEPIQELMLRFHGVKYISGFDLTAGFLQVELSKDCRKYLSFLYAGKSYTWTRIPFGTSISVSAFIDCLDFVLGPALKDRLVKYVDNLLVLSKTLQEHIDTLKLLFNRLQEFGVTLRLKKCEFLATETKFLGYKISRKGIEADSSKIEAIVNFPSPKNLKGLQRVLGMANYYRKFYDHYAEFTSKFSKQ